MSSIRVIGWCVIVAGLLSAGAEANQALGSVAEPREGRWQLTSITVDGQHRPANRSSWAYLTTDEGLRVDVHAIGPAGQALHWSYTTRLDGSEAPVRGNPSVDRVVVTRRDPSTDEIVYKKAGRVTVVGTSVLAGGGDTITVTLTNDAKSTSVGVYRRIR